MADNGKYSVKARKLAPPHNPVLLLARGDPDVVSAERNCVIFDGYRLAIDPRAAARDQPLGLTPACGEIQADERVDQRNFAPQTS